MHYYKTLLDENHKWPYPVNYGKENEFESDVLIIGGGIAGCHAAINAAKKGASVTVVDKAWVKVSGASGPGVDHWHDAFTNPCSTITPEEMIQFITSDKGDPYSVHFLNYIAMKESYDALLDIEKMGMKIRDVDDEFKGAPFRDEDTKLMFSYDYKNKHTLRIIGAKIKEFLYNELIKLNVNIQNYIMITSLLTKDGKPGSKVVGAVGFNVRNGEYYIFKSKATILATAKPLRLWNFHSELVGSNAEHDDPNCAGDGCALAYKAGAQISMMEKSQTSSGGYRYPSYGTGNAHNTWHPCSIVDAEGKQVPWVDRDGKILETVEQRCYPVEGQFLTMGGPGPKPIDGPKLIPNLAEKINNGEYKLPFYADLPGMPEHERRAIWGLMIGNEGKTRVPIYGNYSKAGFNPEKHMLQANVLPPEYAGSHEPWWDVKKPGLFAPQSRQFPFMLSGGALVDWNMRTNLEGLYAAGEQACGGGGHVGAATTGRYAGRNAAVYALSVGSENINRKQIEEEKERIYSHVKIDNGTGWKELQIGLCRIMQDYCGEFKSDHVLETGLWWLDSIRANELENAYALNPHELMRTMECEVRLTVGEIVMNTSLARKSSSRWLDFKKIDYPEIDPPEWEKFLTITLDKDQKVNIDEKPVQYWFDKPYASTYEENYERYANL